MSMNAGNKQGLNAEINVTPLVDVVLVLLIIFMVLTPSMLKHLDAHMPKKLDEPAAVVASDRSIVVAYTAARELTVNNQPVTPEALADTLLERLRGARQKVVFFKAEDEVPYGDVVHLMDVARGVGAQTLAVVNE